MSFLILGCLSRTLGRHKSHRGRKCLSDLLSRQHLLNPCLDKWKVADIIRLHRDDHNDDFLPRYEREISIGELVANEPRTVSAGVFLFLLAEEVLEDLGDAVDFLVVTFFGAGNLLRVESGEPRCLSAEKVSV